MTKNPGEKWAKGLNRQFTEELQVVKIDERDFSLDGDFDLG